MNRHNSLLLLLGCFLSLAIPNVSACGYNWVSDCSSQVHLRINGTLDSFIIAECPSGYPFDGIHLGNLQSLSLANAKTITWESCQNNVSGGQLRYRVYESGFPGGTWSSLDLLQYHETLEGPYTTRYRANPVNISLTNGLTVGKTYIVEVYLVAQVDTIGDDFIPETTFLRNNNGANYKLSFIYGGPTAPPITLLPHLTQPSCFGNHDGNISVNAYGDLNGIFYQWSNVNLNFYQQYDMSSGTYAITLTNASGASVADTFYLGQPPAVQAVFSNIQSVGCNNSPGTATVTPGGGTAPYQISWQNGQQTPTATFPSGGTWKVTVTDAHLCTTVGSVFIGNTGQVERSVSASLCVGSTYTLSGHSFTNAGVYSFTVPASNGCDTLINLTLTELDLKPAFFPLPESIDITCAVPVSSLCAANLQDVSYSWTKDGNLISDSPCVNASQGGFYNLEVSKSGCVSQKTVSVSAHLNAPDVTVNGTVTMNCSGAAATWLRAETDAVNPVYSWFYQGQIISTKDSCLFQIVFSGGVPELPILTVTDVYGCHNSTQSNNLIFVQGPGLPLLDYSVNDAGSSTSSDGSVSIVIFGGQPPYAVLWSNGATSLTIDNLPPGIYCVTVTDANTCAAITCAEVSFVSGSSSITDQSLKLFPNPVVPGTSVEISLPEDLRNEILNADILDSGGKLIQHDILEATNAHFITLQIPAARNSGILMIRISGRKRAVFGKVIVK